MNDHSSYNKPLPNQIGFLEKLTDQQFWDYAQSLATQKSAPLVTGAEALECQTEQGHYLLPIRVLREVVAIPYKVTLLPLSPSWMLGLTAWRGHVIPVVDLASYLIPHPTHKPDATQPIYPPSNPILLILDEANVLLGLQVASVGSIITLEQAQLASPAEAPLWYPRHLLTTLLGVYGESVLLNPQTLINQIIYQMNVSAADEQ